LLQSFVAHAALERDSLIQLADFRGEPAAVGLRGFAVNASLRRASTRRCS